MNVLSSKVSEGDNSSHWRGGTWIPGPGMKWDRKSYLFSMPERERERAWVDKGWKFGFDTFHKKNLMCSDTV